MAAHVLDDPEVRSIYLGHVAQAFGPTMSARAVGMSKVAVQRYIATHPDFAEMVQEALGIPTEEVERRLYETAMLGDVKAQTEWLKANAAEKYGLKAQPTNVFNLVLSSPEDLAKLKELAQRRQLELETGAVIDLPS